MKSQPLGPKYKKKKTPKKGESLWAAESPRKSPKTTRNTLKSLILAILFVFFSGIFGVIFADPKKTLFAANLFFGGYFGPEGSGDSCLWSLGSRPDVFFRTCNRSSTVTCSLVTEQV